MNLPAHFLDAFLKHFGLAALAHTGFGDGSHEDSDTGAEVPRILNGAIRFCDWLDDGCLGCAKRFGGGHPEIQLAGEGKYRASLATAETMDGQMKISFPSLHSANTAVEISGDLLPGIQNFARIVLVHHACCSIGAPVYASLRCQQCVARG